MKSRRIQMSTLSFLAALLMGWVSAAHAAPAFTSECAKFTAPLSGGYCIHRPTAGHSRHVIYYLHGLGGSELEWQDENYYTAQVRREWQRMHTDLPTVVTISFGPVWLLAEKNASPYSGLLDVLTKQIIPLMESKLGSPRGERILLGESMGGFNSAQLALKSKFFDRAAILCAPMSKLSPFSTPAEVQAYIETTSAWQYYKDRDPKQITDAVAQAIQLSRAVFPTPADWANGNPLELSLHAKKSPQLYVTVGAYDRYASFEANEEFVTRLRKTGARVEWRPMWGGHCTMDIVSLARFLAH